jgi:sugar phosphate isomerase/epimerase
VINMKNSDADVKNAFEYAKACEIPTIVCSPDPEAIPLLDKYVKEYDIKCAIHNHGPSDKKYPSPYDAFKLIEKLDKRVGLCVDVGHTARTNTDPAKAILDLRERVYDIHLKDLDSSKPDGKAIEVGRGVLDIRGILAALREIHFEGHVGLEYEKDLKSDPLPGVAESIGYIRGVLAPMPASA